MKIQIQDLKPNPYRDMKNYPMDPVKVNNLVDSIKETGFWDNILARNHNGEIQIAYGHHRLEALKQVMQPTDEVDIPVKVLSDALMIKIMANENMVEWRVAPGIINETVRVAKRYLEEHREEKEQVAHGRADQPIGAPAISKFLGWPETRVTDSLEILRMIEAKVIDKNVVESLPSQRAARDYVDKEKRKSIKWKKERKLANKTFEKMSRSGSVNNVSESRNDCATLPKRDYFQNEQMEKFTESIHATIYVAEELEEHLNRIFQKKNEFDSKFYNTQILNLSPALNKIIAQTDVLFKTEMQPEGEL